MPRRPLRVVRSACLVSRVRIPRARRLLRVVSGGLVLLLVGLLLLVLRLLLILLVVSASSTSVAVTIAIKNLFLQV